jgi:hypothetical protein
MTVRQAQTREPTELISIRIPVSLLNQLRALDETGDFRVGVTARIIRHVRLGLVRDAELTGNSDLVTAADAVIDSWSAGADEAEIDLLIGKLREVIGH